MNILLQDYWLSLLFKRSIYSEGAVTVYALNLRNSAASLVLPTGLRHFTKHQYILTPSGPDGLKSRCVNLNGRKLEMIDDRTLPPLAPKQQFFHPLHLLSFLSQMSRHMSVSSAKELVDGIAITVGGALIPAVDTVKDLGAYLDNRMDMSAHKPMLIRFCYILNKFLLKKDQKDGSQCDSHVEASLL
ncbi:Heparanase [Lamellibrachia satsuma]|nr:Heparanase [Lamellibrachia satsuma]